jgi:cob(I)alamin adenosyltransferase
MKRQIKKIYTRKGDQGCAFFVDNLEVSKNSLRAEACGTVDELNAFLGLALTYTKSEPLTNQLTRMQQELLTLGSQLALINSSSKISSEHIQQLEHEIDTISNQLPDLTRFVLPGGNRLSALLHVARTVCRRAERKTVQLVNAENLPANLIAYLNRLSDWLFVAAEASKP